MPRTATIAAPAARPPACRPAGPWHCRRLNPGRPHLLNQWLIAKGRHPNPVSVFLYMPRQPLHNPADARAFRLGVFHNVQAGGKAISTHFRNSAAVAQAALHRIRKLVCAKRLPVTYS
jgi:hypothetical protein